MSQVVTKNLWWYLQYIQNESSCDKKLMMIPTIHTKWVKLWQQKLWWYLQYIQNESSCDKKLMMIPTIHTKWVKLWQKTYDDTYNTYKMSQVVTENLWWYLQYIQNESSCDNKNYDDTYNTYKMSQVVTKNLWWYLQYIQNESSCDKKLMMIPTIHTKWVKLWQKTYDDTYNTYKMSQVVTTKIMMIPTIHTKWVKLWQKTYDDTYNTYKMSQVVTKKLLMIPTIHTKWVKLWQQKLWWYLQYIQNESSCDRKLMMIPTIDTKWVKLWQKTYDDTYNRYKMRQVEREILWWYLQYIQNETSWERNLMMIPTIHTKWVIVLPRWSCQEFNIKKKFKKRCQTSNVFFFIIILYIKLFKAKSDSLRKKLCTENVLSNKGKTIRFTILGHYLFFFYESNTKHWENHQKIQCFID